MLPIGGVHLSLKDTPLPLLSITGKQTYCVKDERLTSMLRKKTYSEELFQVIELTVYITTHLKNKNKQTIHLAS